MVLNYNKLHHNNLHERFVPAVIAVLTIRIVRSRLAAFSFLGRLKMRTEFSNLECYVLSRLSRDKPSKFGR